MKKYFKLLLIISIPFYSKVSLAQNRDSTLLNDTTLTIDALTSPSSPGSILLGVNPSDIQKPTDLTGIWTSVRNATNNFSSFPTSFAIDIAPKWVFGKKSITYDDFIGNKKVFGQTFTASYSQVSQNDSNYTGLKQGIGFSFSLFRGKITDKKYLGIVDSIHNQLRTLNDANRSRLAILRSKDSAYRSLQNQEHLIDSLLSLIWSHSNPADIPARDSLLAARINIDDSIHKKDDGFIAKAKSYADSINSARIASLKSFENAIVPVRKGFFLNIAAGTIVKYDNFKANTSSLTNESAWLNFGYDGINTDTSGKSYFSFIALSRLIANNYDELYKSGTNEKYTTWDNGLRIVYTTNNQKLSFSGEAIARKLYNVQSSNSFAYKYLANIDFQVSKNQRLTFSYGKDFENHITKDSNVIGYINFVAGIFNSKTFTSK
jgi:hypothetical protein